MNWIAEKLKSDDGERARGVWTKLGKMAFEADRNGKNAAVPPVPQKQA